MDPQHEVDEPETSGEERILSLRTVSESITTSHQGTTEDSLFPLPSNNKPPAEVDLRKIKSHSTTDNIASLGSQKTESQLDERALTITSTLDSEHSESDTRGRQYLLLTLQRLSYIALENQRFKNFKLTGSPDFYIRFINEPVPLLSNNQKWPKNPNLAHFELPSLLREVHFKRKFIDQSPTELFIDNDLVDRFNYRDDSPQSESGEVLRHGHFQYITGGFRRLSCFTIRGRLPGVKPCFLGLNNNEKDICDFEPCKGLSSTKSNWIKTLNRDRKFLESINIWHLINLRSDPNSLYCYGQKAKSRMVLVKTPDVVLSHQTLLDNFPELFAPEVESQSKKTDEILPKIISDETLMKDNSQFPSLLEERPSILDFRIYVGRNSGGFDQVQLSPPPMRYESNEDYYFDFDQGQTVIRKSNKKTVTFSSDTIFIERDMESPFWRDFSERRRQRRIMREQRLRGNFRNRMSFFDILKVKLQSRNKSSSRVKHNELCSDSDETDGSDEILMNLRKISNINQASQNLSRDSRSMPATKCSKVTKFLCCGWCTKSASDPD